MIYTPEYIAAHCHAKVSITYPDGAVFTKDNVDPHGYLAGWVFGAAYGGPAEIQKAQVEADALRDAHRKAGRKWAE